MSSLAVVLLIAGLAVLQSVFGVGVLIFGTPLLLLAGFDFQQVLVLLLPASATISLLQIGLDRGLTLDVGKSFVLLLVPTVVVGLAFTLFMVMPQVDLAVCVVLLCTAFLRASEQRRVVLVRLAARYKRLMLGLIGLVHGATNMGGTLLEAYVSSLYNTKMSVRQHIALGYALLALLQMTALAVAGRMEVHAVNGVAAAGAALAYLTVGRYCFAAVSQQQYRSLIVALMVLAAAALVAKRLVA